MNTFIEILFGVILMFAGPRGASPDDQMRLHAVAEDTWEAVGDAPDLPIIGEAGAEASALALATVAGHESGFWVKVQDCSACFRGSQWCDKGRSVSLYQLHEGSSAWGDHSREQICQDNAVATKLALRILTRRRTAHSPHALFKAMGGRIAAAAEMDAMFQTAAKKVGLFVTYRNGRLTASWRKSRATSTPQQP